MKKSIFLIIVGLLLGVGFHLAINCYPEDMEIGRVERGCDQIFKRVYLNLRWSDGLLTTIAPYGYGTCLQALDCNPLIAARQVLLGKTQCWPLFDKPYRGNALWEQAVWDRKAVPSPTKCSDGHYSGLTVSCQNVSSYPRYFRMEYGCSITLCRYHILPP